MIKIPKNTVIKLDVQGRTLKGDIKFSDSDVITLKDVDSINTILRNIYEKESKTIKDLINEGRVVIGSSKVWDNYVLTSSGYFVKNAKEKVVERVVVEEPKTVDIIPSEKEEAAEKVVVEEPKTVERIEETTKVVPEAVETTEKVTEPVVGSDGAISVVETSDKKEETKKDTSETGTKIKLKTLGKYALALIAGGVILVHGLPIIENALSNLSNPDPTNPNKNQNEENSSYESVGAVEVDGDYGTTVITDDGIYVDETPNYYYEAEGNVYYEYGFAYDDESIIEQTQTVNNFCYENRTANFENLVVASDKDAIKKICDMRDAVINGTCSYYDFMNNICDYVISNSSRFNGKGVTSYYSLKPFAQYITLVCGQTMLQQDYTYQAPSGRVYPFDEVIELLNDQFNETCMKLPGLQGKVY